jgi:hypothetical protein
MMPRRRVGVSGRDVNRAGAVGVSVERRRLLLLVLMLHEVRFHRRLRRHDPATLQRFASNHDRNGKTKRAAQTCEKGSGGEGCEWREREWAGGENAASPSKWRERDLFIRERTSQHERMPDRIACTRRRFEASAARRWRAQPCRRSIRSKLLDPTRVFLRMQSKAHALGSAMLHRAMGALQPNAFASRGQVGMAMRVPTDRRPQLAWEMRATPLHPLHLSLARGHCSGKRALARGTPARMKNSLCRLWKMALSCAGFPQHQRCEIITASRALECAHSCAPHSHC